MSNTPKRVREPVQVYLDQQDRSLLDAMSERSSLPRAELLRLGLRRLSAEILTEARPGSSMATLVGALDSAKSVPTNLAERHDDYLYAKPRRAKK